MKRKQKKKLAIAGVVVGIALFIIGVVVKQTLPPEPAMSDPGWFEARNAISNREMGGFVLMGVGGFMVVIAIQELVRQAKKLKV